jgi:hypothetical protein
VTYETFFLQRINHTGKKTVTEINPYKPVPTSLEFMSDLANKKGPKLCSLIFTNLYQIWLNVPGDDRHVT